MEKNLFIVLEGLSAVGKTTIAKDLAIKINGCYFNTPGKEYGIIRDYIDRNVPIEARYLFYLSSVIAASRQIAELLKETSVVCDRYIYTTTCWHKAMGVKINVDDLIQQKVILKPDFSFLITCDYHERMRRMEKRGISHYDRVEISSGVEEIFLKNYQKCGMTILDNTANTDGIIEKIISCIK